MLKNTFNYLWSFPFIIIWQGECCAVLPGGVCLHLVQAKASKIRRISLITHLQQPGPVVRTTDWKMNTVDFSILPQIPKYWFVCLLLLNAFSEFFILCGSSCSEEKKMWLKNSHSCNSCQSGGFLSQPNRTVLRKSLLSTEIKGENLRYFCRAHFAHTHKDAF